MDTLSLVLALYGVIGVAALALTLLSKSHRIMNVLAVGLPASYIALTFYALIGTALPAYGLGGDYFLVDHLSLYEILIAAVLFLLAAIYSRQYIEGP